MCGLLGILSCLQTFGEERTVFRVDPAQKRQVILGFGFEIQCDSIGSGNQGLPDHAVSVPRDLIPAERARLAHEMLAGFRYCRLAAGLYWRGLDVEGKQLQPRWPTQLIELQELLGQAGVEGISLEYWSPAPFWKANGAYIGHEGEDPTNVLRCFGPAFADDPVYRGDVDRFLADFAHAVIGDIQTLEATGLRVSMWGLQNEPFALGAGYSKCSYLDAGNYVRAYKAVAAAVRAHDRRIMLISDTDSNFPRKIAAGTADPAVAELVDAYVVHTIGAPSEQVRTVHDRIRAKLPFKPWFQNEYEYLHGGATPERCLNTVQHIMDSFQLAGNPTWFWLHVLKPFKNAEASGYALGFWRPGNDGLVRTDPTRFTRWQDGPEFTALPGQLKSLEMILPSRGDPAKPGAGYSFSVNQAATLYLLVEGQANPPMPGWERTELVARWVGGTDVVYRKQVAKGEVRISAQSDRVGDRYGVPHAVFIEPSSPGSFSAAVGVNAPIFIRSEFLRLQQTAASMAPGTWIYNPYNWNAVGSFVKRLPWNSMVLQVEEDGYEKDARILAFQRPDGKRTIVVSNRTGAERAFTIATGLPDAQWRGFRYSPQDAGERTLGVEVGHANGPWLKPVLPNLSWEFWEEI